MVIYSCQQKANWTGDFLFLGLQFKEPVDTVHACAQKPEHKVLLQPADLR